MSVAYAQTAATAATAEPGFNFLSLLPIILIFVVFYFLVLRPQQKKERERQAFLRGVKRGDKVVTAGGIVAEVVKTVSDQELLIEIAEGVRVRLMRQMIVDIARDGTTASAAIESPDVSKTKSAKVTRLTPRAKKTPPSDTAQ